jgi:hypothetical protein
MIIINRIAFLISLIAYAFIAWVMTTQVDFKGLFANNSREIFFSEENKIIIEKAETKKIIEKEYEPKPQEPLNALKI